MPCVPSTGLRKYVPSRFAFHIAVLRRSLLTYWLCALTVVYPVKTLVQTKRPIYADVKGGAPPEVGSKQWLDSIMEGLASRHLKPPMRQVRFLAQDDSTVARLQKATSIKQQLDIVCRAAFKAKLGWQKVPGNMVPAESARVDVAPTPAVQTWGLRPRDWKVCKPASTDELPITGNRADAFRKDASGGPLNHLWTRHAGAYFLSAAEAARVVRSIPAHKPPTGLFTLVTLEPTGRSEPTAVETVVLYPDDTPHMVKVFLSHLGTEKALTRNMDYCLAC